MASANATFLCPCGSYHPLGTICDKIKKLQPRNGPVTAKMPETNSCKASMSGCNAQIPPEGCLPENNVGDTPAPTGCCCEHEHAQQGAAPLDLPALGQSSDTLVIYRIMAMDCPMEEALIRKKLEHMPGIEGLEFNLMQRVLKVKHSLPSSAPIEAALNDINMRPDVLGLNPSEPAELPQAKTPWGKLAVAGVLAALSEFFELVHEWNASPLGLDINTWQVAGFPVMTYLPGALAIAAILLSGLTTYKKGWVSIKNFNLNINALMSVAVTGAIFIGQYPEAAMVMVLFNLSEAIEGKSLDRARKAIKNLVSLSPERATLLQSDGVWVDTDVREIAVGNRIRVRPGERIGLDGTILSGQSAVNQAPITGESLPVEKTVGDSVYAGTINESGSFEFEVTAPASNSTLARIIHAVEEAQGTRAPIQRFIDKFAQYYTPAIFIAAILVAVLPPLLAGGAWKDWVYTALVLLVIGCPCALVISTPITIVSGMAAATRLGVLIKGGIFLEQGRHIKWLALDKTGTITHGKPVQTDFVPVKPDVQEQTRALAGSLAGRSDHPVSKAIAEQARKEGIRFYEVDHFMALPGRGVRGVIGSQTWYLGNYRLVQELEKCSAELREQIFNMEKQGKSVVALINSDGVQGLFAVADTVKPGSIEAIKELGELGVKTMLLTGDNEHSAQAIAEEVGVDAFKGNLLPQDKLAAIEILAKEGTVAMVGDGINDAPALAKANIGFAMASAGTDTAIETADVALMDDDLRKIPRFIRLSKSTYAILVQNIALALGIKAIFLALALMGLATMWMAVFADVGTSLLVVANGLRAMRK